MEQVMKRLVATGLHNQYQYEPLIAEDAVRILSLEPADDFQSPLRCSVIQHQRSMKPLSPHDWDYSAVSYTWGDPQLSHTLLIKQHSLPHAWGCLHITANVDSMLRHFRASHDTRLLWIDSICLNQLDSAEKVQQIPLMDKIYNDAKRVHIWLGVDDIERARDTFFIIRKAERCGRFVFTNEEIQCLAGFFKRPWFTRRWVIQEVAFSYDAIFHCGHYSLSLSRVMPMLEAMKDAKARDLLGRGAQMLLTSRMTTQASQNGSQKGRQKRLLSLIWDLHESECSNPQDRIAAVYAMASSPKWPSRRYDSGNWKEMYRDMAAYYINADHVGARTVLNHLFNFGSIKPDSAHDRVPSWVPDWSTQRQEQVKIQDWETYNSENMWKPDRYFKSDFADVYQYSLRDFVEDFPDRGLPEELTENFEVLLCKSFMVKIEATGPRLRLNHHPSVFIHACGIADRIIYSSSAIHLELQGIMSHWSSTQAPVAPQILWHPTLPPYSKFSPEARDALNLGKHDAYGEEVESLDRLLDHVLGKKYKDTEEGGLKATLRRTKDASGRRSRPTSFSEKDKALLQEVNSTLQKQGRVLVRVQTAVQYVWAVGPSALLPGDWLLPVTMSPMWWGSNMMCLRPHSGHEEEEGTTWYPSLRSGVGLRYRRFKELAKSQVNCLHVTGKFVGAARGFGQRHGEHMEAMLDPKTWTAWRATDKSLWVVMSRAYDTAMKKGLPGPTVFDFY